MVEARSYVVGGKYELIKPIARGGMGTVWEARHVELGNPVAIKFLDVSTNGYSEALRIRFAREARAAANLRSPHIAQVHDYGLHDDSPYLVMELLHGEDLNARLHRVRRLSLQETLTLLEHVTKGLRRAHEAHVVHRDLKPGNLFMARVDDDEVVKILDFGIAKAADAGDATKTGEIVGSPHYMSPEQLRADEALDHRSDLWSLGVILYRCITGKLPFPAEQITAVMMQIISDPVPSMSDSGIRLPPELDAFFKRALARAPADRFQSGREMFDAFKTLVAKVERGGDALRESSHTPEARRSPSEPTSATLTGASTPYDAEPWGPPRSTPGDASPPKPPRSVHFADAASRSVHAVGHSVPAHVNEPRGRTFVVAAVGAVVALVVGGIAAMMIAPHASGSPAAQPATSPTARASVSAEAQATPPFHPTPTVAPSLTASAEATAVSSSAPATSGAPAKAAPSANPVTSPRPPVRANSTAARPPTSTAPPSPKQPSNTID